MEQETNTKISIKGKGMRGSANLSGESDEELHVHITGEDDKSVDAAAKLVLELLQPKNEEAITKHKEGQLRELVSDLVFVCYICMYICNIFMNYLVNRTLDVYICLLYYLIEILIIFMTSL